MISEFYQERLLIPGWAGLLTYEEAMYIKESLKQSLKLRQLWGLGDKRLPLVRIAEKAYPENPEVARRNILSEMARNTHRAQKARQSQANSKKKS